MMVVTQNAGNRAKVAGLVAYMPQARLYIAAKAAGLELEKGEIEGLRAFVIDYLAERVSLRVNTVADAMAAIANDPTQFEWF